MNRRAVVALLGGASAAFPFAALGQQPMMRRIGALIAGAQEADTESRRRVSTLRASLEASGWAEGQNLRIEYRWPGTDATQIQAAANDLVRTAPDVIFAHTTLATTRLLEATRNIPIVFASVSDPVGDGIVASFSRPGGNVTGFTNLEASVGAKWLEILKELAPDIRRVAFMYSPTMAAGGGSFFLKPFEAAASHCNPSDTRNLPVCLLRLRRRLDRLRHRCKGLVAPGGILP